MVHTPRQYPFVYNAEAKKLTTDVSNTSTNVLALSVAFSSFVIALSAYLTYITPYIIDIQANTYSVNQSLDYILEAVEGQNYLLAALLKDTKSLLSANVDQVELLTLSVNDTDVILQQNINQTNSLDDINSHFVDSISILSTIQENSFETQANTKSINQSLDYMLEVVEGQNSLLSTLIKDTRSILAANADQVDLLVLSVNDTDVIRQQTLSQTEFLDDINSHFTESLSILSVIEENSIKSSGRLDTISYTQNATSDLLNEHLVYISENLTSIYDQQFYQLDIQTKINNTATQISQHTSGIAESNAKIEEYQEEVRDNILKLDKTQTDILEAIQAFDFAVKVNEVIAATEYNLNCPSFDMVQFDGDVCEYDPLGFGPINCDLVETEVTTCAFARLRPED